MLEFDMIPHPFRNKVVKDPIKHEGGICEDSQKILEWE